MTSQRWMLTFCFLLVSVLGTGESITTTETQKYTCRTFGSGVVQPFNGSAFYVRSTCPFSLTRFTHNRVECDIVIRRGDSGLLAHVEIIVNKVRTELFQNGSVLVEKRSVSLPYDHTYQHIFQYGIYTRLRSSLLPLSVTWHSVPGGIDTLWVELTQELSTDMTGLCGKHNVAGTKQQLITDSVLTDDTCQTQDIVPNRNSECRHFISQAIDCLKATVSQYTKLCEENIYGYEKSRYVGCAFFKQVVQQCGSNSYVWDTWRVVTKCLPPSCPGDLMYKDEGPAFIPSCSNPNPKSSDQDLTCTCMCPEGKVLNDRADGFRCINVANCPCELTGKSYSAGDKCSTKCQSCLCVSGKWHCSKNVCPAKCEVNCQIEGQFVTTFDGKHYAVPGKCTYVASQGLNWLITIKFSEKAASLKTVILQLFQETYTFTDNMVKFGEKVITELHQSDHALVYWQSSMYVQVHTSFGMKILVQMSPEIQLDITPPTNHAGMISGLCGNSNNDTTDDFNTSSGIIENSAQPFALSWSLGVCALNIPHTCINTDNEIFAEEKCYVLNQPNGTFANCHNHIPTDLYYTTCIQRTCNCMDNVQQCLCVALASYAKACACVGVEVGDWRKATGCTPVCPNNQRFYYDTRACNRTCLHLSNPDPRCGLNDISVEGCGCLEGTYLNKENKCTPKAECRCHYKGGTTPPGPAVLDGQQCICENGKLNCSEDCGCSKGMVCVHCSRHSVNTAQKTCDSLSKPLVGNMTCESGCYCPHNQYKDHHGNCVSSDNCTCMYSGKVFSAGETVKTDCKTCTCSHGQWHCTKEPCPGKCQVYGNGHYQTFDYKWYRFDGHCQYTLVEDDCGRGNGTFSIRVESVPCCDEALTCSRAIVLDLQDEVTLTLNDMKVTRLHNKGWSLQEVPLYTTHTVGLYIIISVPSRGVTLIWDKHTRITIKLSADWRNRVCGLCGNFDYNEMNDLQISNSAVVSSPLAFGNSWKVTSPPCSDVTTEIFPCERNSYCLSWAQRRCMILTGDTFKDCFLKVDPEPYYHACVQESCSCEFEGKFLGFCTAVAAYAEACSDHDVCVKWRTPDLCPVYCDFYNEQGQCSWHYEACGKIQTCRKGHYFTGFKLEGCFPRCPKDAPYYDENTGECTNLRNCTCFFNDTVIQPGTVVMIQSNKCPCENGTISCPLPPTTPATTLTSNTQPTTIRSTTSTLTTSTSTLTTSNPSTATETWSTAPPTTSTLTTSNPSTATETWSTEPPTTSTLTTSNPSTATETWSTAPPSTSTPPTTSTLTSSNSSTETWSTEPPATSKLTTSNPSTATETWSTAPPTTSTLTTSNPSTATETWSTEPPSTSTLTTSNPSTATETWSTEPPATSKLTSSNSSTETWSTEPPATSKLTSSNSSTLTSSNSSTETWSTEPPSTSTLTTSNASTATETWSTEPPATSTLTTSNPSTATETWSTEPPATSKLTSSNSSTETWSTEPPSTSTLTTSNSSTATETWSTEPPATSTLTTSNPSTATETWSTEPPATSTLTTLNPSTATETWSTEPPTTSTLTTLNPSTATETWSTEPPTTSTLTTLNPSTATETWSTEPPATSTLTTLNPSTATETWSTEPPSTSTLTTLNPSTATETWSTEPPTTSTLTTLNPSTATETWSTEPPTTSTLTTLNPSTATETWSTEPPITSTNVSTTPVCECKDLKKNLKWACGESWTEDCFNKICANGRIELTPVVCPDSTIPNCPSGGHVSKVSDECCELWKCDCRCELYGDPHYMSFQSVQFSFLDYCTYILMEEQSPRYNLTIAVDNFDCGFHGSCAKGIIMQYQNNTATLNIIPHLFAVQATLNNVTIQPPYEAHGLRFETTDYLVSIYLTEVRSSISLTPYYSLVVNLAMEHFLNNTQGQCGVCGGGSCIRRGGQIEDNSCCDKTAYDWVYDDPGKPACASAPRNIPCHQLTTQTPTSTPCPGNTLCELMLHSAFANCSQYVDLYIIKQNCEFDSCGNRTNACSTLEYAAQKCKIAGFCIDWRRLTNGTCDVPCSEGLVYGECHNKLDDFCFGGIRHPGASLQYNSAGCFCPNGLFRAGNHSNICVDDCRYCKGPLGEHKKPGDVWQSNCHLCTCNNQTLTVECSPLSVPSCGPNAVFNTSCCGNQTCVEKTCSYNGNTYKVGDRWKDAAHLGISFTCGKEGIQTETEVCPSKNCPETCDQSCVPKMSSINITIDNCTTVMHIPVCQGHCVSPSGVVLNGVLQVEAKCSSCQERSSERRSVSLQCSDLPTQQYAYKHITSCECRACTI
ncbi:hypothetical protein PAMA_013107 [Pampus argenteus]